MPLTSEDKKYLKNVAVHWAQNTLDSWVGEIESWDDYIAEDFSYDDREYVQKNFKFNITVEEK